MNRPLYIYDPTATDEQSKVRGIGRYIQLLKEHLGQNAQFISDLKQLPKESTLINPFFNFTQKPPFVFKKAHKQIAIIHDVIPMKYSSHFPTGLKGHWYTFLNKWALGSYDIIVTDSLHSKEDIKKRLGVSEKKIQVIYPPVTNVLLPHLDKAEESVEHHHPFHKEQDKSVAEFSSIQIGKITNEKLTNVKDYIIYVGDATWNKNLTNIARAIKIANIPCVFVGKVFADLQQKFTHPWQKELRGFAAEAANNPLFIFPGYVSDLQLLQLYKNAKLNVLVSRDEGFGFSYLEAAYASTPSVLADSPIFHEISKGNALFANPEDPKDIAQKIIAIYYDQELREKLSVKAFERAQDFNTQQFKNSWIKILEALQ